MAITIRPLVVLYGSQTGTAQEIAERIGREGNRLHFDTQVSSMDEFPVVDIPASPLIVYVASTTGQGEEPDNMKKTWKFLLRKNLPSNSLSNQRFGVLGLGDSSYPKFNYVAKKLSKRLIQLGGIQLLQPGLGDDQHDLGPDFVVDSWLVQFWDLALQMFPLPAGVEPISKDVLPPPKFKVVWVDDNRPNKSVVDGRDSELATSDKSYSQSRPFLAPLLSCDRQTPKDHFQDVRLVRLDISNSGIMYKPGDIALIQPSNLEENVEEFFSLFPSLDPERKFVLEPTSSNTCLPPSSLLPRPCTLRHAVSNYFDIQSIPKRYFFELLSHFSSDELEKEKFLEFNTAEGQQDMYDYCNRPRRHILEVLYDFRHTTPNIPVDYLWDLIPQIKPRSFSIASSPSVHGDTLELLVAVVRYRSSLKKPRIGLCSNWLTTLKNNVNKVPLWIRPGSFTFPPTNIPVVLVGPGTGVAPFRSFILEDKKNGRPCSLFFGCRNKDADFFFSKEWSDNKFLHLVTAFSRDQEDKIYVQHRIEENHELLCDLILKNNGWFYVAGNSKNMPTQVKDALVSAIASEHGLGNLEEAKKHVEKMEINSKYQTETWA